MHLLDEVEAKKTQCYNPGPWEFDNRAVTE